MTLTATPPRRPSVAVIGGGPAGLMAAERLCAGGSDVRVYERMPTLARRLLMAGRGGLNLTHSEPLEAFLGRYGPAATRLEPILRAFPPSALIDWAEGLGQATFTGSSGRVFPRVLKASPLLRAWLGRLEGQGVQLLTRHDWRGWTADGALRFIGPAGEAVQDRPDAVILALGGASWPRLGSTGDWVSALAARGVAVSPLRPANCGFITDWSTVFRDRFQGQALKAVAVTHAGRRQRGEVMITAQGLEGGAIYALSATLRAAIEQEGSVMIEIDLRPDETAAALAARLAGGRSGDSLSTRLKRALRLSPAAIGLLREIWGGSLSADAATLAAAVKAAPVRLTAAAPLARAISTAGGIAWSALEPDLGAVGLPGVFAAGEMIDWEAPTGGYLLQACFATGAAAAAGVLDRARTGQLYKNE